MRSGEEGSVGRSRGESCCEFVTIITPAAVGAAARRRRLAANLEQLEITRAINRPAIINGRIVNERRRQFRPAFSPIEATKDTLLSKMFQSNGFTQKLRRWPPKNLWLLIRTVRIDDATFVCRVYAALVSIKTCRDQRP